jgi:tetratricopeptide (TPR) repeat protein
MTSDPLRTDTTAAGNAPSGVERDAKIEQLLLAGLDHYFAAQYEQAINVWTRALFFDRNHPRARAYIERARRAQAERQRVSEELLHNGAVAYRRGDGREARRLLQAALDAGAPFEDAFPMLERLNQLEAATPPPVPHTRTLAHAQLGASPEAGRSRSRWSLALGSVMVAAIAATAYGVVSRGDWRPWPSLSDGPAVASIAPAPREMTLSVPTGGELALAGARTLVLSGDLHGALSALDRVRPTDAQKAEADRLRADLQRRLILSVSDGGQAPATGDPGAEPRR